MNKIYFIIVQMLIVFGCGADDKQAIIPDHVFEITNVTVITDEDYGNEDTIKLTRDQVFGDTENIYIGRIREFTTDESNRLYVIDSAPGAIAIHVFAHDGSYITNVGRMGEGPGEYLNPCCLKIRSNKLYVFDHGLARLTKYSLDTFEALKTVSMDPQKLDGGSQLDEKRFKNYYYLDDETLLLAFINPQKYFETEPGSIQYFTADTSLQQLEEEILVQDQILEVWGEWNGRHLMKYYPFYSKPLITVTPKGRIFYANSGEFFIRELSKMGNVIGGIYVPLIGISLNRDDVFGDVHEMEKDIANNTELPDRWPVIKSVWSDDNDRLWISTFTETEDELEWWVIDPDGELLGKFRWPGNRNAYPLISGETFKHIRGNYFYTREDDEVTGAQTVVRYQIELKTS